MKGWLRRQWWLVLIAAGIVVALAIGAVLSQRLADRAAPLMEETAQITDPTARVAARKDLLQYQTDNQIKIWTALVQGIGAVVLAVGGYFAWRNWQVAQRNLEATQEKLVLDRVAQVSDRFTQAIGQLGAETNGGRPNVEVRLGGIYALEGIAKDSNEHYLPVIETIAAYVRQNTPSRPHSEKDHPATWEGLGRPPNDIRACLTVLMNLMHSYRARDDQYLDLRQVDLRRAELNGANLVGAHFFRSYLDVAELKGANLTQARLREVCLDGASLQGADLTGTNLDRANLRGAKLDGAKLEFATSLTWDQLKKSRLDSRTTLPALVWDDMPREVREVLQAGGRYEYGRARR